jgi:hypothetical protein
MHRAMPPQLPLQARPNRRALMNGSVGSRDRIIGIEKVRIRVVEAMLDRKPAIRKFMSIKVSRIRAGRRGRCLNAKFETRSIMFILPKTAVIVIDPKKTKFTGSIKLWANAVALCEDSSRRCVLGSIPIPSQTARTGTI